MQVNMGLQNQPALAVRGVSFSFGAKLVLDQVSFSVREGEFKVLLGPNGAGKSTLYSLITRLYHSPQGNISVWGNNLKRNSYLALRHVGVVFHLPTLDLDLTVRQNLQYHASLHGLPRLKARERMTMELEILEELGFIDYILLNWEVLNFCKEKNIPTGPGRGSAAGSLVLFFLGVTKVDPIKYNLFFERFVSRHRAKRIKGKDGVTYLDGSLLADVDNDIAYDRRSEVIEYIKNKYEGRTCKILNLVTLSGKLCIKEVGKLVGLKDEEEMNDISDQIPVTFG